MDDTKVRVIEYTDPICSWAWGTEPKLRLLRWRHEHRCEWRTVMGGLVGDNGRGRAGWDPMSEYWRRTSNKRSSSPSPAFSRRCSLRLGQ